MNNNEIINKLKAEGLTEIEEIAYSEGLVLRFRFDFDDAETDAAKAYANDESGEEEGNEVWFEEFFLPYLSDLAIDNVGEIIEDIIEDFDVDAQFVSYDMDEENYEYSEFIAVFFEKDKEVDIEEVLEELEL